MPGMYELNEEVVCRRRASGDVPLGLELGPSLTENVFPGGAV
jgi:hypothetical protein